MQLYLTQLSSLQGTKVGCFVTEYFPYPWMGGTRALRQMIQVCEAKGVAVFDSGIVNWSSKKREKLIADVLQKLTRM